MSDEIKKPEETADVPLAEEELDKVVGGEAVSLNFTKIEWTYTPQKPDGSAGQK
jgi:type VI protein secretion system component Hcp